MIHTVKTNELHLQYIKFGTGDKALVILPGLSVKSVLVYEASIAAAYSVFTNDYTVYLLDRRLNLSDGYSIKDMAEDTAAVMNALGIEKACIFGVSQGGMAAQQFALDHPDLVEKLVLCSTAPKMISGPAFAGGDIKEKINNFMAVLYSDGVAQAAGMKVPHIELSEEELKRFELLYNASDGFDVSDRLGEIKCPTLVLGSSEDKILPPEASVDIAMKIGCELYMYGPPYGHTVFDEAPDYKNRVFEFLQRDK
ncbi:MAG: alpha/beta hydrolase [Clostridia bacterium]|nr:alpha/beta hydrolase [Clostridia bacterium]